MVKKIRFALSLPDGTQARSLDDLKEHFDLETVLGYYKSGKLLTWLRDRYIETEADAVEALDEGAPDFQQKLCAVFGVEFSGSDVDMEEIIRGQERMKKLRQFTDEDEFIQNIDAVAFDQEDLIDLLDEGCEKIYLCGEMFTVPASQRDKAYIGINSPKVKISGNIGDDWAERKITFSRCDVENSPVVSQAVGQNKLADTNIEFEDINEIPVNVADDIHDVIMIDYPYDRYIETEDSIVFLSSCMYDIFNRGNDLFKKIESLGGICAVAKKDGTVSQIFPEASCKGLHSINCWIYAGNMLFALSENGSPGNASVCALNLNRKIITPLGVTFGFNDRIVSNGKYFVTAYSKVVCIDIEQRKKYTLAHELDGGPILCTEQAAYFVSSRLQNDRMTYMLIEYTFANRAERVVAEVPNSAYDGAVSFYEGKIYLMLNTGSESKYVRFEIGCIDLNSMVPQKYQKLYTDIRISKEVMSVGSHRKSYRNGWIFIEEKSDYPIVKFDFKTTELTTLATGCGYIDHGLKEVNSFQKIGNWIYSRQGNNTPFRVSIHHPMEIELLESDL